MGLNFPRGKMLTINNATNCCKPRKLTTFTGSENSDKAGRKVRYKHYEQMSDENLKLKSVLKAHREVQESSKMRLFKAMPEITTALIGTSLALAQPGKLAAKAGAGLGFLVLSDVLCKGVEVLSNKTENEQKETSPLKTIAKVGLGLVGVALAAKGVKSTKAYKNVSKFVKKEANQLAQEINNSKIGKFVEEKIVPFTKKHSTKFSLAPYAMIAGSALAQLKLSDSLSNDIKEKASLNYQKGKLIQQQARAHFDSIDAQED